MAKKIRESVDEIWNEFVEANPKYALTKKPASWYFCDNEKDADECADLVVGGIKQATCSLKMEYDQLGESLPQIGQIDIVTNWAGEAKAIIKIIKVEEVAFNQVTEDFAAKEGEGDRTLQYWRTAHWDFFTRLMKDFDEEPSEEMILVCEHFEVIWTTNNQLE